MKCFSLLCMEVPPSMPVLLKQQKNAYSFRIALPVHTKILETGGNWLIPFGKGCFEEIQVDSGPASIVVLGLA